MNRLGSRADDDSAESGSVTLFLVIAMAGLIVLMGLVVDGGAKVRAVQRADSLAAEAGRAGGQAINVPAAIVGDAPTVDARTAVSAANAYLARNGAQGTVTVTNAGRTLNVNVTTSRPTIFLGLIGVSSITVTGHASVTLVPGINGATP